MNQTMALPGTLLRLVLIFVLQNTGPVGVNVFFWRFHGSLALVLLLTFALGYLTSLVIFGAPTIAPAPTHAPLSTIAPMPLSSSRLGLGVAFV